MRIALHEHVNVDICKRPLMKSGTIIVCVYVHTQHHIPRYACLSYIEKDHRANTQTTSGACVFVRLRDWFAAIKSAKQAR